MRISDWSSDVCSSDLFAGAMQQVSAYMRGSPADVFVAQEGVRTMHMTQSALPPSAVDAVASVEGVAWAEGLRYTNSIVDSGRGQRITYADRTSGVEGKSVSGRVDHGGRSIIKK